MPAMTSLMPPAEAFDIDRISTVQRRRSAKRVYMRNRSAANSAASSPPVPARISRRMFFSSFGSLGISSTLSVFSRRSCSPASSVSSWRARSRISGSFCSSRASAMRRSMSRYCAQGLDDLAQVGVLLASFCICWRLASTAGSASIVDSSS